jgi:hypothetical protein
MARRYGPPVPTVRRGRQHRPLNICGCDNRITDVSLVAQQYHPWLLCQTGGFGPRQRQSTVAEGAPCPFFRLDVRQGCHVGLTTYMFSPPHETDRSTTVVRPNQCQLCAMKVMFGVSSCTLLLVLYSCDYGTPASCRVLNLYAFGRGSSHCISWYRIQLVLTACDVRYHTVLWDNRSPGQL